MRSERSRPKDNYLDLLYLGQVVRHKGLAILAEALKMVNRDDLRLHVAGDGDYLEQLRRELSDWSNVHFYGYVSGEAKADLLSKSDAFVLPSIWYDNAPIAIIEAYRYGLPVIGSNIGGIPEMIQENKTGFLFEPGNVSSLASILRRISLEQLRNMTHDCQKAAQIYTMKNHVEKLLAVYNSLTK
jgi:glycosyltransferase involved in cell wall biosynthesis